MKRKPWRDPALDNKPAEPQHVFPAWFYGDVRCDRCHRTITEIDARALPCVTDRHIAQAATAGAVFAKLRKHNP